MGKSKDGREGRNCKDQIEVRKTTRVPASIVHMAKQRPASAILYRKVIIITMAATDRKSK
jgi:hypothetical protein